MPKKASSVKVESLRHQDKRANIPTEELRDFVAEEEPQNMLYPRDVSLDPQLVWKGKDAQDRSDLTVRIVPIYIQEKIHPQAIIHELLDVAEAEDSVKQLDLFADFNGGPAEFEQKVDFYHHQQNWTNRLILGDSLLVMTSLAEKEGLKGKIQTIYMDPPYGIDFGSNWQVSTRKRQVEDGKAKDLTRQPEQITAFRDTWKDGIHSYLSYLRDRIAAAWALLTPNGSLFVQIGDDNMHLVRSVMDEVFLSEHHVATFVVKKKGSQKSGFVDPVNDYVLWYSKAKRDSDDGSQIKFHALLEPWGFNSDTLAEFKNVELPDGSEVAISKLLTPSGQKFDYRSNPPQLIKDYPDARFFRANPLTSGGVRKNQSVPFSFDGHTFAPPDGSCWKHTAQRIDPDKKVPCGMERLGYAGRLIAGKSTWRFRSYLDDFGYKPLTNWWDNLGGAADPIYVVQTNVEIVKRCILMTTDPGDIVLDPTCGSGTTAFVAEQWGRRWITCDTSRVALALARTRLMSARYPYYLLADSAEGMKKDAELSGRPVATVQPTNDVRKGFVYKRVRHVTSASIANNPDIKEGMSKKQIESIISRHDDSPELLYDQPYEDTQRIRVTGPFSVEGLSPYRVLSTADDNMDGTVSEAEADKRNKFFFKILENLRASGVENRFKGERLNFELLESYPGVWIQAVGEYSDREGKRHRVAVSIGPEHGTVGSEFVKEAAKEAVLGVGFDVLVVCGFAFDSRVNEEAKRFGKLVVLPAKMNPDLAMSEELLKKTNTGNLFMVFGEPDIDVSAKNNEIKVELKGVDVYDPTTGEVRSSSTTDIACWFIDTKYSGEAFFVRHAYFTGGQEPYEKLKKALRSEVDEEAWRSLYSTVSRSFGQPKTGKIAVKVINHYGDEVMKVFDVKDIAKK